MMTASEFALKLYAEEDEHLACDIAYNHLDDLQIAGLFAECDESLNILQPSRLSASVIISCLIITRRASRQGLLPKGRPNLVEKVKAVFMPARATMVLRYV